MNIPDLNFGDLFEALAQAIPQRTAIIYGDAKLTWRELDERSNRLARKLMEAGLRPGSKVAFYLRNSPAYLELFVACSKARLTHANVNYLYVDNELFHVLDNSDAEAVVYDAEFGGHVETLAPRLPKVRLYLAVGDEATGEPAESFEKACSEGDAAPLGIERSGDDLYFMYTGGTTGYPKAVMWPHKHRIAVIGMARGDDAARHAEAVAASPISVLLPACPLMHSTGFTTAVASLLSGGTTVLLPTKSFDAEVCLRAIDDHKVQTVAIVGDAFSVPILEHLTDRSADYDLSSVRVITSAGAMWSAERKQQLMAHFPNASMNDSLGSSEGSRLGSRSSKNGDEVETARFQLGPHAKVFTEDFREVEPGSGEAGLIATAGPIPLGYYKDDEGTAKTFPTINGVRYAIAGDWCRVESDGSITLLGRGNNCINSGGEKIYPEEVEEALKLHPLIHDVAVIGIPDDRWGQAVAAVVNSEKHRGLAMEDVRSHLSGKLARYKHPKRIEFVDGGFRHANGKVNYRLVRKLMGVE